MEQIEEKQLSNLPEGAEPIREEEFYRLPDYVHELMAKSLNNELPSTTSEELQESLNSFLKSQVESQNSSTTQEDISCEISQNKE